MLTLGTALLFAKDLPRLTAFYRDALGLPVLSSTPDYVELDAGTLTLGLHAVPPAIAASIAIASPAERRADTPLKLIFHSTDLTGDLARARAAGALVDAPTSWGAYDALDPEGNVFQLVAAPASAP